MNRLCPLAALWPSGWGDIILLLPLGGFRQHWCATSACPVQVLHMANVSDLAHNIKKLSSGPPCIFSVASSHARTHLHDEVPCPTPDASTPKIVVLLSLNFLRRFQNLARHIYCNIAQSIFIAEPKALALEASPLGGLAFGSDICNLQSTNKGPSSDARSP